MCSFNARWHEPDCERFAEEDSYLGDPNDPTALNRFMICRPVWASHEVFLTAFSTLINNMILDPIWKTKAKEG